MFPFRIASDCAEEFLARIADVTLRIAIAGSLRRCREYLHDIDILIIPLLRETCDRTLFAEPVTEACSISGCRTCVRTGS